VKLQPQPDKYYLLEVVDDPAGKTTSTTTKTTIERPEGGYTIDETQTETDENKLKFSLLFAKDFGPLTFRGGLMESQGGAGLEYRLPWGRPASLGLDSWDFGRDEGGPHLKLTGKLALYKDVFLTAGVDDIANESRRSVFLGGGILFSDEDLRQLLNLATLSK
jgi:phospholipid/cholesterol/gamma-HCH transport system substrate-binding protein